VSTGSGGPSVPASCPLPAHMQAAQLQGQAQ